MKDESFGIVPVHKSENTWLFLLVQHQRNDGKGHWAFPKGHRENRETEIEAATRELYEETGLENSEVIPDPIAKEQYTFWMNRTFYDKTVTYFLAISPSQEVIVLETEISDFKWLPYDEALALMSYDEGKNTLHQANKYLLQNFK